MTETEVPSATPPTVDQHLALSPSPAVPSSKFDTASTLFAVVFWAGVAVIFVITQSPDAKAIWDANWQLIIAGTAASVVLVAVLLVSIGPIRRRIAGAAAPIRVALVTYVILPVLLLALGSVVLLRPEWQVAAIRGVFLVLVCLLPSTMYYLFIRTRKSSLLNEFVSNLDRLGLLKPVVTPMAEVEREHHRRLRVLTYLQKFEAAYGPLDPDLVNDLVATSDPADAFVRRPWARTQSVASVFTPEAKPPIIISTLLMGIGWLMILPPWQQSTAVTPIVVVDTLVPRPTPVDFAFLGSYFFAIQMLFRRYVLRDLRVSAYVAVSQRIILAVIGTWVLMQAMPLLDWTTIPDGYSNNVLTVMAFVVGVFPPIAWHYVQGLVKKITKAQDVVPSLETQLPISDLDGLTVWHQSRFEEEDVENIPNMATASLVDLLLNTRFAPERVIDWVDQAILYTSLGQADASARRQSLQKYGIRTATALIEAWRSRTLPRVLGDLQRDDVTPLIQAIATNPNIRLVQTWRTLPPFDVADAVPLTVAAR
jgi:hypothetical protein